MTQLAVLLLALTIPAAGQVPAETPKAAAPAQVTITAELACLHCTFGEGDGCAVCLKLDDKTPVVLAGQAAKQFAEDRLSQKVVVVEGVLTIGENKRLLLTSKNARLHTEQDKTKAPVKGQTLAVGAPCCGHCDLKVTDGCTLAIVNTRFPIVLDGKLATQYAEEAQGAKAVTVEGKLFLDKQGLLRLQATKVEINNK
jgi:hypothetical protein